MGGGGEKNHGWVSERGDEGNEKRLRWKDA
jgi:hypothetical protein